MSNTKLLESAPIISELKENLQVKCEEIKSKTGTTPSMHVILVGNNPASVTYTRNKKRFCEKIGAACEIIKIEESVSEEEFLQKVEDSVTDKTVHGILIQLPLPKQLQHIDVSHLVPAVKDVDGFHDENLSLIMHGDTGKRALCPCTPKGILTLLDFYKMPLEGKNITIIGRSMIVGKPLQMLFTNLNATVTLAHSRTANLKEHTKSSDIVVVAIGKAKFLDSSYLDLSKKQTVIDVGINHDENRKICGDANTEELMNAGVHAITPVPGGVGPLTIFSLVQNLLQATNSQLLS
jgi:methylenetetrahydrofolate dehydrogenase (NADP+) / methenyltetrahydrofolate cyclohydrolase